MKAEHAAEEMQRVRGELDGLKLSCQVRELCATLREQFQELDKRMTSGAAAPFPPPPTSPAPRRGPFKRARDRLVGPKLARPMVVIDAATVMVGLVPQACRACTTR